MLNSKRALCKKGLGIECGAVYRECYLPAIEGAKIAMEEEYVIESIIRGFTFIRVCGILYWESRSPLGERIVVVMTARYVCLLVACA